MINYRQTAADPKKPKSMKVRRVHLWDDLVSDPHVIEVENASNDIDVFDNYLRFASYDSVDQRYVIGIGEKNSPRTYGKWWASLDIAGNKGYWKEARAFETAGLPRDLFS